MVFGEAVPRGHRAHPHGSLMALGELDHFVPRVIARDAGTDDDHRSFRLAQRLRRFGEQRRIARRSCG